MTRGDPPLKSRAVTLLLVTLQRPPPLIRTLAPSRRAPSSTTTSWFDPARAAVMAAMSPAAPAPTTRIRPATSRPPGAQHNPAGGSGRATAALFGAVSQCPTPLRAGVIVTETLS